MLIMVNVRLIVRVNWGGLVGLSLVGVFKCGWMVAWNSYDYGRQSRFVSVLVVKVRVRMTSIGRLVIGLSSSVVTNRVVAIEVMKCRLCGLMFCVVMAVARDTGEDFLKCPFNGTTTDPGVLLCRG